MLFIFAICIFKYLIVPVNYPGTIISIMEIIQTSEEIYKLFFVKPAPKG